MSTRSAPHEIPVRGTYTIRDPLTHMEISGRTFEQLLDNVTRARYALGVASGLDMRQELEDWVCRENPDDCTEVDMGIPRRHKVTLSDVLRGTKVMMSFVASGRQIVDRAEAERRAMICVNCEFNQSFPKPCTGVCGELLAMVKVITGQQGTQYDVNLHACGICGCFLQSAIWLPLEVQCRGVNDNMAKQFSTVSSCWKQCEQNL